MLFKSVFFILDMEPCNLHLIVNTEFESLFDKSQCGKKITEEKKRETIRNLHHIFNGYGKIRELFRLRNGKDCLLEGYFHTDKGGKLLRGKKPELKDMGQIEINLAYCENYKRIANFYRCHKKGFQGDKKSEIVAYLVSGHTYPILISTESKKIYVSA